MNNIPNSTYFNLKQNYDIIGSNLEVLAYVFILIYAHCCYSHMLKKSDICERSTKSLKSHSNLVLMKTRTLLYSVSMHFSSVCLNKIS